MGAKSRGCFPIGVCLRGDCLYHGDDEECKDCLHFSKYEKFGWTDAYKQPLRIDETPTY
jgi:hypothetical protein